jgi:WD40 repeat protein
MQGTFSPDGQRIAIWPRGLGTPSVWERDRPNQLPARLSRSDTVAMSFSPDGQRLLGGGGENRVLVWDATTFELLGQFQGHTKAILDIAFSPDGRWVATASEDGTARIWPADAFAGPRMLQDPQQPVQCIDAAFSPDGRYLATAGGESGVIWETATGKALHRLRVYGTALGKGLPEPKSSVNPSASPQTGGGWWLQATTSSRASST